LGRFPRPRTPRGVVFARGMNVLLRTLAHTREFVPPGGGESRDVPRAREGRSRAELRQPRVRTRYDECWIECARTVLAPRRALGFDRDATRATFRFSLPLKNSREKMNLRASKFFYLPIKRGSNGPVMNDFIGRHSPAVESTLGSSRSVEQMNVFREMRARRI
jgi:hypothetical protein